MYKITKVINNNFICSFNDHHEEVILRGPGIGFQKKPGDDAEEAKIEKIYQMASQSVLNKLQDLVSSIPLEQVQICTELIDEIKKKLSKTLNDNIYITLTDHLSFAMERQRSGLLYKNALLWEIKKFYQTEFQLGLYAIEVIKDKLGVTLQEDEAGFIALHIVNAELDTDMSDMMKITTLTHDVLDIIQNYYQIKLNEDSMHYERFLTHMKYFGQRLFHNKSIKDTDFQLQKMIMENYNNDYQCAVIINNYINEKYNRELTGEEMMFLTIHLRRITMD